MLLYRSANIALQFDAATAVLSVEWPTLQEPSVREVRQGLQVLVNYARNYHIENLLLDESDTVVNLSQDAYRTIVTQFVRALHSTRLQRVACVMAAEPGQEKSVKYLLKAIEPSIMLRSFVSKEEALDWLVGPHVL